MLGKRKIILMAGVFLTLVSTMDIAISQETVPLPTEIPGLSLPVEIGSGQNAPAAAPVTKVARDAKEVVREEAFDKAAEGLMPMRPGEIRRFLEMYDETQEAVETPLYPDPKPLFEFKTVSLDPGQKPLGIVSATGHVTTVTFVDATGAPWPIRDISWAGDFNVEQPDERSHMMRLIPMSTYAHGNMSMTLVGLDTPIIFKLVTKKDEVHYRLDLRIPELGPSMGADGFLSASAEAMAADQKISMDTSDTNIVGILDGSPAEDALMLDVSGVDGRTSAYDLEGKTYLRTPHSLLSPTWEESVRSADGMNVYVMASTPVLLLSDRGKVVRAYLSREE